MCGDDLLYGNFGRHFRAFHEPLVNCETCGKEFNAVRIKDHMKKCVRQNFEFGETSQSCDFKVDHVKPKQVAPPTSKPIHVHCPNHQDAVISKSLSVSAAKTSSSKSKDNLSSHPTYATSLVSSLSSVQPSVLEGYTTLTMISATVQGVSLKVAVKEEARVRKVMKKFGVKFNADIKAFKFMQGSSELTGDELVSELEGSIIHVNGELPR
eukprot:GFUD01045370.1.p1 GENE.GFUD01045370.1~~GFUD01045370.1.p1  ORF type:complete len:210 (+),score=51.85 GFUD01045370.1:1006-1635(+)